MAARVFALIIGIDDYKSGRIWNLESCADDAQRIRQWLMQDLHVPKEHISTLLNKEATQHAIERTFMSHLVNNPSIERGDAIIFYFAGHGSSLSAPANWNGDGSADVQILCPYDHDTRGPEGRISGLVDRSLHALLREVCETKGDNVTVILDCCFSRLPSSAEARDRRYVRWTPTTKATPEDLLAGLWRGKGEEIFHARDGFYQDARADYTTLLACRNGEKAMEGKDGGKFTIAFLSACQSMPVHQTKCTELMETIVSGVHGQHPVCLGRHKDRILFGGIPFVPDGRFVPVEGVHDRLRIEMGAIHGIVEGTEFSMHSHNRRGSLNPAIDSLRVLEVHPTWSLARRKSQNNVNSHGSWAQITRWNNRTPLRVYFNRTWASFLRRLTSRRRKSSAVGGLIVNDGLNVVRVRSTAEADLAIGVHTRRVLVQNLDDLVPPSPTMEIQKSQEGSRVLDEAARFHLHLHRTNPENPFRNLIKMEIFRVDPKSRKRVGRNLLENGQAKIVHDEGAIYAVVIHNASDVDLWPYLAYMDTNGFGITLLYHPHPSTESPPLRKRSFLEIGCGGTSGTLAFPLSEKLQHDSGFLKLFVCTSYTSMGLLEQGPSSHGSTSLTPASSARPRDHPIGKLEWDTELACLTQVKESSLPT